MSCRNGAPLTRGATSGPQPLRALIPFKLHSKAQPGRRSAISAGKSKPRPSIPGIRRTHSLDAIVGPYLQGHWPKELESEGSPPRRDRSTQTPDSWSDGIHNRGGGGLGEHKRSASWGSADHLREITKLKHQFQHRPKHRLRGGRERDPKQHSSSMPGTSLLGITQPVPIPLPPLYSLRHSVEGLNQELEGMFVRLSPQHQPGLLEVPDGHRAPVPSQCCSSSSQSDPSSTPLSSPCSSPSPCPSADADVGAHEALDPASRLTSGDGGDPLPLLLSSSPRPNKSYSFQREPPEGCERVRVCEETTTPPLAQSSVLSHRPDPNKVNFVPHGGSAFCPVSLLSPLLPSMDLLFRSLAVTPGQGAAQRHQQPPLPGPPTMGGYLGPLSDAATTAM